MKTDVKRAFPVVDDQGRGLVCADEGMSLRDWFAGQALAGILADPEARKSMSSVAADAYDYADAMMKDRDAG